MEAKILRCIFHYQNILKLWESGERDIEKYQDEILLAVPEIPPNDAGTQFTQGLQKHMDHMHEMAFDENVSDRAKMFFGLSYMEQVLNCYFEGNGLGKITHLDTDGRAFRIEIIPGNFTGRKDGLQFHYKKMFDHEERCSHMSASDENKEAVLNILESVFSSFLYTLEERNGIYTKISVRAKNAVIPVMEEPHGDRRKSVEDNLKKIAKSAKNACGFLADAMASGIPSIMEHACSAAASEHYIMCSLAGCCREYIEAYESTHLPMQRENRQANQKAEQIGSMQTPESIKRTAAAVVENLNRELQKLCLCADAGITKFGLEASVHISYEDLYEKEAAEVLKHEWMGQKDGEYFIKQEGIEVLKKEFQKMNLGFMEYSIMEKGDISAVKKISVYTDF